ncbi:hypothetical protein Q9L58_006241 [Maublancomyces gigas]|uniref:Uncharacterized protein n=1 Tax=Discina gigas TaxID=1032678 RepID=A0ABR3GG74_9PEZI
MASSYYPYIPTSLPTTTGSTHTIDLATPLPTGYSPGIPTIMTHIWEGLSAPARAGIIISAAPQATPAPPVQEVQTPAAHYLPYTDHATGGEEQQQRPVVYEVSA